MLYGATGYTGRLMADWAVEHGLRPLLAGRDEPKLAALAERLGLRYRTLSLTTPEPLEAALADVRVVLHAAGPFAQTAQPMVTACLETGTHYLDISGEVDPLEALAARDGEARKRKIMIMPGVGMDVVPSDCLAAHVAARLPGALRLALGVSGLVHMSRGSAKTMALQAGTWIKVRRNGIITTVPPGSLRRTFDYGQGPRMSVAVSWGDVSSAYYTTGIPNIETYFESNPVLETMLLAGRFLGPAFQSSPWQDVLGRWANLLPEGPTAEQRATASVTVVAEAEDATGRRAAARLRAPEGYGLTAATAATIAKRVLAGDLEVGFQTPARVYGPDFILGFVGVAREDLD